MMPCDIGGECAGTADTGALQASLDRNLELRERIVALAQEVAGRAAATADTAEDSQSSLNWSEGIRQVTHLKKNKEMSGI